MVITENCISGQASYGETIGQSNEQREGFFYGEERGSYRGSFERKSNGEKQEFRVAISHGLSCWDGPFLVGDAMYIPLSAPGSEDSLPSRILLFAVYN